MYGVHGVSFSFFFFFLVVWSTNYKGTAYLDRNDDDDDITAGGGDENLGGFSFSGFINFPDLAIESDLILLLSCYFLFFLSFCCALQGDRRRKKKGNGSSLSLSSLSLSRNSVLLGTDTRDLKAKLPFLIEPPLQSDQ